MALPVIYTLKNGIIVQSYYPKKAHSLEFLGPAA